MRIATYNLRFGGSGRTHWNAVLEQFNPEILLTQESFQPTDHLSPSLHGERHLQAVWSAVETDRATLKWGSSVFTNSSTPSPVFLPAFKGWVVGAEVGEFLCPTGERRSLRIFSVHAPSNKMSYQRNVNLILDMLLDHTGGCDVVIGGDFNLTVSERRHSEERQTTEPDRQIQARLREEFGLMNCWQVANPDVPLAQTLRWSRDPTVAYHCDGLFVPKAWGTRLLSCHIVSGSEWDGLSDHNPVVAEFGMDDAFERPSRAGD